MKKSRLWGAVCAFLFSLITVSANAALISRLGGLAYYDDIANLTWLADSNYAQTSGYDADGLMAWDEANTWATNLNVAGITGWRLPMVIDVGNDGATYTNFYQGVDYGYNINTTNGEMAYMFYETLGNTAYYDTSGTPTGCTAPVFCLTNTSPFSHLQPSNYWSGVEYAPDTSIAWYFSLGGGDQNTVGKGATYYAWAVQSGDVAAVPLPPALWLFGTGLLGLVGIARKKAA